MLQWSAEVITLPLKYTWKISRNASTEKQNLIIQVGDSVIQGKGEVAPNVRYGENPILALEVFQGMVSELSKIDSPESLYQFLENKSIYNSLRFGIESAFIHYWLKKKNVSFSEYFKVQNAVNVPFLTSYTVPILDPAEIESFLKNNKLHRFKALKVKINMESGEDMLVQTLKHYSGTLRIDPNEAFDDVEKLIHFLEKFKKSKIEFIEQPMKSNFVDEYIYLKKYCPFEVIADESITDSVDWDKIQSQFHGINMKLMKAGSYKNGINLINNAKKCGLKTMIGCMVETSLGIFSAINLCNDINYIDLDGHFLIENEPFNLVQEDDGMIFIVN